MTKKSTKRIGIQSVLSIAVWAVFLVVPAIANATVGGQPAYPRDDNPRTESIFVHAAKPGDVIEEGVIVVSTDNYERKVRVYATDYSPATGGGFACKQYVEEDIESGAWISLGDVEEMVIGPLEKRLVPFTITVPESADAGEHNACIVIEPLPDVERGDDAAGVLISTRSAIRVATLVSGDLEKSVEIESFSYEELDNSRIFTPVVKNTGSVSADIDILVPIRYALGPLYVELGGQYPTLRGTSREVNLELNPLPFWGGWYDAQLIVRYDPNPEAVPGTRDEAALTTLRGDSYRIYVSPQPLALVIEIGVVVLLSILLLLLLLRIKQNAWIKKSWIKYSVKDGEDIQAVAKASNVSWKLLARVNKLNAPYSIETGYELMVPLAKDGKSEKPGAAILSDPSGQDNETK